MDYCLESAFLETVCEKLGMRLRLAKACLKCAFSMGRVTGCISKTRTQKQLFCFAEATSPRKAATEKRPKYWQEDFKMDNTYRWDMADHIQTRDDAIGYLEAALEENDTEFLFEVIGDVARSQGMAQLARELNLSRENLYRSLSKPGNPSFATVFKLLDRLGYKIEIKQKTA
jgi:probable addiction module antidote protein